MPHRLGSSSCLASLCRFRSQADVYADAGRTDDQSLSAFRRVFDLRHTILLASCGDTPAENRLCAKP
jgi:hypothetical protein